MDISGLASTYTTGTNSASTAAAESLTSSLNSISSDSSEEELKGAIEDFESYFVEQILKEMKETFAMEDEEDEDSTMSQYKDMYMDEAIQVVADEVVDQLGGNVTQQLYEQMCRNINPNLTITTAQE
jgi:flagellar protein FlgJ